jgi:hypothetical protein
MLARCDFGCLSLRSFAPCRRLPMRTRSGFFLLHLASHSSFYDSCRAEQPYVSSTAINVGASKLGYLACTDRLDRNHLASLLLWS